MRSLVLALLLLLIGVPLQARCSRAIEVPLAPIGRSVVVQGKSFSGLYPDLMRAAEAQGCRFDFQAVPRARQEMQVANAQGDVLIPATRSERREPWGEFVPLIEVRPVVLSLRGRRIYLTDTQQLLARKELRMAVVRGFDFGVRYREVVEQLRAEGRLVLEVDAAGVARALQQGTADFTLMTSTILLGALEGDERLADLQGQFRVDALSDLPWMHSGLYLHRQRLPAHDRALLRQLFERAQQRGEVWRAMLRQYPQEQLAGSVRPLSAARPARRAPSSP